MGLYLGMIVLLIVGDFRANLTRVAVIGEVVFMFGLALGRVVSIVIDGMPSMLLVIYAALEIAMALRGIRIIKRLVSTRLQP